MLIDRPNIVEGSSIQNATVASGPTPPSNPNVGELFYNTALSQLQTYTGGTWDTLPSGAVFSSHLTDASLHLTSAQNTLLDGLNGTLTSTELNYVDGVTSPIQTQLTTNSTAISNEVIRATGVEGGLQTQITSISGPSGAFTLHAADASMHLTGAQNTFLDGLNLPTLTAADVNAVPTTTANLSTLTTNFNTHAADLALHLTGQQNTFLDGISYGTVTAADINRLNGLGGFLVVPLSTYLQALQDDKLNRSGSQPMLGDFSMGGHSITNLANPVNSSDAATKDYVDSLQQGLQWKDAVRVATTANITLSGLQTIDGVALASGNRVLVKNQAAPAENGLYNASASSWSRTTDANTGVELDGAAVFVQQGGTFADTAWVQVNSFVTFPGDPVSFSQFAAAGGAIAGLGIQITGSQISVRHGNGLTFSGQDLTLAVSSEFVLGTTLDLSVIATAGTYKSVTIDNHGRVTSGTNPTTLAGYGITNAVLKTGDTMSGNLGFTAGTVILANAPATLNAYFSTAAYASGQGDNRTHFGYNSAGTLVNFIRGVTTTIDSALVVQGSTNSFSSAVSVGVLGSAGNTVLRPGSATNPGYLEFNTADGTRRGYVGWNDGSSRLLLASENGWNWTFSQNPTVAGNPILNSANFNTYAPTLTGTGASGTWGINITGNAATASSTSAVPWSGVTGKPTRGDWATIGSIVNVVGQLSWKNYGNGHTIFDASAGTSPDGGAVNNSVPTNAWTPTYPTLMGWNGSATYGVKVNRADLADLATKASTLAQNGGNGAAMTFNWSGQAGQPNWLWGGNDGVNHYVYSASNFSVANANTVGNFTPSQSSGVANRVVVADGNGYIFNNYLNTTDNSVGSGVTAIMAKAGDNYYRSATAAAVAAFISGQNFNTTGNASTSSNTSSISNAVGGTYTWTGTNYFQSNKGATSTLGANSSYNLESYSTDGGAAAMSFHRAGAFAVNLGLDPDNVFRIGGWSAAANRMQLDMSGNVTFAGNVTAYSDARLKTDIEPIYKALDKVSRLEGVSFKRIDTGEYEIGVIAQQVQKVVPEVVKEDQSGHLSVAYGNMVGLLIEAIKELKAEIEELKRTKE